MSKSDTAKSMKLAIKVMLKCYHCGAENVVTAATLANRLEKSSRETVRKYINEMRKEGIPICSSRWGYYYPASLTDVENTINHLESRIEDITECITGLYSSLLDFE